MPTATDLEHAGRIGALEHAVQDLGARFAALERRLLLVAFLGSMLGGGGVDTVARLRAALDASAAPVVEAAPEPEPDAGP